MGSGASRPAPRLTSGSEEQVYVALLAAEQDKSISSTVAQTLESRGVRTEIIAPQGEEKGLRRERGRERVRE